MTAPLPRLALKAFEHMGRKVAKGDALDAHDELVALRPDLFTTNPNEVPTRTRKPAPTNPVDAASEPSDDPTPEATEADAATTEED